MSVLIIAEPGMTWDRDLSKAFRLIDAAKQCGADVCKFQWTSSGRELQERRQVDPKYIAIYEQGVQYPREWLEQLKGHCDEVGIEFACTSYLIEDIAVVAPLVKRFKISAYESAWHEFVKAHVPYARSVVISIKKDFESYPLCMFSEWPAGTDFNYLYCVSEYPTPLEHLQLRLIRSIGGNLSDHTANVLTGAAAVAAGASIVEAHIKLHDTDHRNPDWGHSLQADGMGIYMSDPGKGPPIVHHSPFGQYVDNIRTVERML